MKQLFFNGSIVTVNDAQPMAEALLEEDGKITAVGNLDAVKAQADADTVEIDLQGKTVLPGFYDGHGHIANVLSGFPKLYPSPNGNIDSKEALFDALRTMIAENKMFENGWLVGIGYDNTFFENGEHPTREELDNISRDIPMFILQSSGHVGVVNSKVFEMAGWDKNTPDPEGGVIQRDPVTGEPSGVLEEKALQIIGFDYVLKGLTPPSFVKMFVDTQAFYAQNGVTTAQEGGITFPSMMQVLESCRDNDMMLIDVSAYPWQETVKELIVDDSPAQTYDRHLKIGGAKIVGDGSPQAKTAWLTEPYYVKPYNAEDGYKGYPIYSDEQMYEYCKEALEHNWQMLVHCNGDAMGDQFIRSYRKALADTGNKTDLRPVMIHAQTVREDQLDDMKELGIMPSFFNDHVFYWGDYHADSILGPERASRISPMASAVKRGMKFTLHTDMPVAPINPIFSIHNAVNRVTRSGRALGQEYCIDVMEAIKAVTIYGAYQYFDENIKGSLEVGKLADLVILDKNPLTVPKETIKDIRVLETIKEGKIIYKAE